MARDCAAAVAAWTRRATPSTAAAAADLNGDGKVDLAVVGDGPNLYVLENQGNASFTRKVHAVRTKDLGSSDVIVSADVDGDGALDLVFDDTWECSARVLFNDGSAGVLRSVTTVVPGASLTALALADFDADGFLDLAASQGPSARLFVMPGDGTGSFQSGVQYQAGYSAALAVADLNLDGSPDLLSANWNARTLGVLLNDGTGQMKTTEYFGSSGAPAALAVADFDRDGWPDVAVANYYFRDEVDLFRGTGAGVVAYAGSFKVGTSPQGLAVADLDLDGWPDLAVANAGGTSVSLLMNVQGGFANAVSLPANANPMNVVTGDFDGDGRPDLAAVCYYSDSVVVLLNDCP